MTAIRLLFWLKWKLLLRGNRLSKSQMAGSILLIVVLLPVSIAIALGSAYVFSMPPKSDTVNWLLGALLLIYLFWIFVPILGFSLNDSYDISKLFVYPVTMRQVFAGTIAGTLLDRPTILLLPTFASILWCFRHGAIALLIDIAALALFLLHTLALSQAILMAGAGLFRSRRFRDAAAVLIPLLSIAYYLRYVVARHARLEQLAALSHSPSWTVISSLPHGWAARAIYSAYEGRYSESLADLAVMAGITYLTIVVAGRLLQRIYAGETASAPARIPATPPEAAPARALATATDAAPDRPSLWTILPHWTPPAIRAVAEKEFRYLARDPYYKMVLVNLIWPLVPVIISLRSAAGGDTMGLGVSQTGWLLWMAPPMMTFSQMNLCFNIFGTEGGAIGTFFLFPVDRRQMVIGKNVFHFCVLSFVNMAMIGIVLAISHDLSKSALLFYWMELALLVNLAMGNMFSIYFPARVVLRGWRVQNRSSGEGCLYFVMYLGVWIASLLLFVPVAAAMAIPVFHVFDISEIWLAVTLPFGMAYVAAIYVFSIYLVHQLLPKREEAIIAKVAQEPQ
ncbi:MAG TPA: hypothetical protein VKT77_17735 [Chthonomonadaceae bacterium]|nr:hypothetical protein [Chthonomonadaceae bacterium]